MVGKHQQSRRGMRTYLIKWHARGKKKDKHETKARGFAGVDVRKSWGRNYPNRVIDRVKQLYK